LMSIWSIITKEMVILNCKDGTTLRENYYWVGFVI